MSSESKKESKLVSSGPTPKSFHNFLKLAGLSVIGYHAGKGRPIELEGHGKVAIQKFCAIVKESFRSELVIKFPNEYQLCLSTLDANKMVQRYCQARKIFYDDNVGSKGVIPPEYLNYRLNLDETHQGRELKFFLTEMDTEIPVAEISGNVYLRACSLKEEDAIKIARRVVPRYRPRNLPGIFKEKNEHGIELNVLNTYIPPAWPKVNGPKQPRNLPRSFRKLVWHLFPLPIEREYFFNWLHASLFSRSYVYLVLCGAPGVGKNRLKLIMRALHGHFNAVDGKRSTFSERFNSQLDDSTLVWFDELHYNMDMENAMKEVQNDSISIERKNYDSTRSTQIYSSFVISNNKPRDNYIAFDARKFAPLILSRKRLDTVMSHDEITELTNKVEKYNSDTYDLSYIAQIGWWVKNNGWTGKWPNLEYKGPMFYKLAHTSMSRWQKKAASTILELPEEIDGRCKFDREKGFLWSSVEDMVVKRDKFQNLPDYSTVRHFFELFRDGGGNKGFSTKGIKNSLMGDFWVKCLNKEIKIINESDVMGDEDNGEENSIEDYKDLL